VISALKLSVSEHSTFSRSGDSQNAFEKTRAEKILPNYEDFDISGIIRPLDVSSHGSWFLDMFNKDIEILNINNTGYFCIAI
jgi:hypothetical protein